MATSVDSSQSQNVLPKSFECEKRQFHYLTELDEREFYLLCRARDIACYEPFDDGRCFMGSSEGRV